MNGNDVVARLPRTINTVVLGKVNYDHCAPTVLISHPDTREVTNDDNIDQQSGVWIEGRDKGTCSVRDGQSTVSPLAKGSLIGDIVSAVSGNDGNEIENLNEEIQSNTALSKEGKVVVENALLSRVGGAVMDRLGSLSASDIGSLVGLDGSFVERETKIVRSIFSGNGLADHMEDRYYRTLGNVCGFVAEVGEDIKVITKD